MKTFVDELRELPVLAILRGITPDEAVPVGEALLRHGVRILEVPLNSPEPFDSIRLLADRFGAEAVVGAGTVLQPDDVGRVADAGGEIVVAPNFNPAVVAATKQAGLTSVPGVFTPTEALAALEAGADVLKIFPGDAIGPKVITAVRAVLPKDTCIVVTGGVNVANIADFLDAGADGVGIGSALYKPGRDVAEIEADAKRFVAAARRPREGQR